MILRLCFLQKVFFKNCAHQYIENACFYGGGGLNSSWSARVFQGFYSKLALSQVFLNYRYHKKSFKQGSENSELNFLKEEYYHNLQYNYLDLCLNGANDAHIKHFFFLKLILAKIIFVLYEFVRRAAGISSLM